MNKYTITENENGFSLEQSNGHSKWPITQKKTAREIVARLMQLMDVGPVAPQVEPEKIQFIESRNLAAEYMAKNPPPSPIENHLVGRADRMSHPLAAFYPEDEFEEFEDESHLGICSECKEHTHAFFWRHKITGDLHDKQSACCSAHFQEYGD